MSEIQDLLNASTQDMVDDYLIIDDNSREIYVPLGELLFGVINDEKTERKYFQCPRIVGDNVDLTQYQLYINYQNANGEKDKYIVTDVKVVDDNITFTWLLSRKVTEYQGNISFIVCARNVDSLGNITNEWNTTIATGTCVVGLEVDDLTPGEQEQARDYFLQLEKELSALAETENNRLLTTSSNQITNITNKGSEQVQLVENTAKKALDSIPSTYTDLQKQVNEVEDRELKDANGITQELTITDGYAQLTDAATKRLNSLVIKGNSHQLNTTGKNLFDINNSEYYGGGFSSITDGVIKTLQSTSSVLNIPVIANKAYTLTFKTKTTDSNPSGLRYSLHNGKNIQYGSTNANGTIIRMETSFSQGTEYIDKISFTPTSDWVSLCTIMLYVYDVQLERGSTATSYEPYTGCKPSPSSKYPQEVKGVNKIEGKVVGKNLVSDTENGYIQIDGTVTPYIDPTQNEQVTKNFIKLNPKQKYLTYSYKATVTNNYLWLGIGVYDEKYNFIKRLGGDVSNTSTGSLKSSGTYEIPSNAKYIKVSYRKYNDGILQLEYGQTATNYQPYQSQSFNYTLSNPLYRLSDTVYDYIDLNKGKIIRNVGIVEFDGSSDENWLQYNGVDVKLKVFYSGPLNNKLKDLTKNEILLSNKLIYRYGCWGTDLEYTFSDNLNNHFIYITMPMDISNTNVFKQWLSQNPITVYYQLSTPTEEDIPTELLTQLKQLQTYSGETNISFEASDVYPTIDLEYIKDTKKYIESKEELDNQSIIDIDYRVTCLELDMEEQ